MDGFGLILLVALIVFILGGALWRRTPVPTIETGHGGTIVPGGAGAEAAVSQLPARWVRPGEVILLGHVSVHGGLFYFGHVFPPVTSPDTIPNPGGNGALIDPRYPVGDLGRESEGVQLTPPFGYDAMDRRQRRHFLQWLSGPREDSAGLDPGFVLIYFQGLERRLMVDRPAPDREAVRAEVRRLAALFSGRPWFHNLPEDLLQASEAADGVPGTEPAPAAGLWAGSAIAPAALVYLGRRIARDGRLDATAALLWVLADRGPATLSPAMRVFPRFQALFLRRFRDGWPEGLPVPRPAERLRYHVYRASNGAFETRFALGDGSVPDLRPVWDSMAPLRAFAGTVADDLDAHARFVSREPHRRDSPEARALLPADLMADEGVAQPGAGGAAAQVALAPRTGGALPPDAERAPPPPDVSAPAGSSGAFVPVAAAPVWRVGVETAPQPPPASPAAPVPEHETRILPAAPAAWAWAPEWLAASPLSPGPAVITPKAASAEVPPDPPAGRGWPFEPAAPVPEPALSRRSQPEAPPADLFAPPEREAPPAWLPPPPPVSPAPPSGACSAAAPVDGLAARFGREKVGIVPLAAVLKAALIPPTWPLPLATLGARLDARDVGFEPDPRCGALPPAPEAGLSYFPAPAGGAHRPAVLAAGRALIEAVALLSGRGQVSDADFAFLDVALQAIDGPTPEERTRLWAYVAALYADPAPGRAVVEALGRLPAGERQARIRAIRQVFPHEDPRTRVCALRLAMALDALSPDDRV